MTGTRPLIPKSKINPQFTNIDSKTFVRLLLLYSISLLVLASCAYTRGPELQARHDIGSTLCERDVSRVDTEIIHAALGQEPKSGDVTEDHDFIVWASALATTELQIATVTQDGYCWAPRLECGPVWLGCWYVPGSGIRRPCKVRKEIPIRDLFGIGKVSAVRLNSSGWDEAMVYAEQLALQACTYKVRQMIRQTQGELEDSKLLGCKVINRRYCD